MRILKSLLIVIIFQFISYSQETSLHKYRLIVKDVDGNLLSHKQINYSIISDIFFSKKVIKVDKAFTSENGEVIITAEVPIEWEISYLEVANRLNKGRPYFSSMLLYEINDSIHYPVVGYLKSCRGGLPTYSPSYYESEEEWYDLISKEYQERILILASNDDYFSESFLSSKEGTVHKNNLDKLLDYLIVNKIPADLYLKYNSISFEQFKKQTFISFEFQSNNIYNSNKLDEYDIVKRLLDDNVYILIKEIDEFLYFQKNKICLNVNIEFYSENFLRENSDLKKYEVKYYFLNDILKKYLMKDISRQELISKSTILLNEDKIEIN